MYQVRTDLALEAREKFKEDDVEIKGVSSFTTTPFIDRKSVV